MNSAKVTQRPAETDIDAGPADQPFADQTIISRLDELNSRLDELTAASPNSAGSVDREKVEDIAQSNQQILQVVANQGDAISQLALALSAMRETLAEISSAQLQPATQPDDVSSSNPQDAQEPWEQIRNAILEAHEPPVVAPVATPQPEIPRDKSPLDEEFDVLFDLVSQEDIKGMDESRLRLQVIDQERIIARLVRRVQQKSRADLQLTPDQLQECAKNLPEELAVRVEATLQTLDEQARLGELELSLERARISRQMSQLESTREILESNARVMGLEIGADGKIEGNLTHGKKAGSKGRRWLGALGFVE